MRTRLRRRQTADPTRIGTYRTWSEGSGPCRVKLSFQRACAAHATRSGVRTAVNRAIHPPPDDHGPDARSKAPGEQHHDTRLLSVRQRRFPRHAKRGQEHQFEDEGVSHVAHCPHRREWQEPEERLIDRSVPRPDRSRTIAGHRVFSGLERLIAPSPVTSRRAAVPGRSGTRPASQSSPDRRVPAARRSGRSPEHRNSFRPGRPAAASR